MPRLYEFLFRGEIPEQNQPAAWHVWLADDVIINGKSKTVPHETPITPNAAKDQYKIDLPDIMQSVAESALRRAEQAEAFKDAAISQAQNISADLEAAIKVRAEAEANLQGAIERADKAEEDNVTLSERLVVAQDIAAQFPALKFAASERDLTIADLRRQLADAVSVSESISAELLATKGGLDATTARAGAAEAANAKLQAKYSTLAAMYKDAVSKV